MGMFRRRQQRHKLDEREIPDVEIRLKRLITYLTPYKIPVIIAIVALILSSVLSLAFPAFIGGVGELQGVLGIILTNGDTRQLNIITLTLLGVFFLRSLTSFVETYFLNYVGERIVVDIRKQLYAHLQTMSLQFFTDRRVGELISRLSSDVTVMRNALTRNITTLLQQSLVLVGSILIMVFINWRLSLFILVQIPLITAIAFAFGFYMRRISTEVQDEIAGSTVVAEEVMQNIREVKSFVREPYEIRRYNMAIDRALVAAIRLLRIRAVFGPLTAFLGFTGLSLTVWFGGKEVIAGRLVVGELVSFLIYGFSVGISFAALTNLYTSLQETLGAMKRIFQILDSDAGIEDSDSATDLESIEGQITFANVDFSYDSRQQVLHDVTLTITPGEIIALVGPSGAGKSTIFNLIPRFYDVTDGSIAIDDCDVRTVTQMSLRQQIGIVPQESLLFGGTIRENILYGRLDATESEMIEAAQAANVHEFVKNLPDGYETIVGERGIKLSGGQRQRVAIARALLKNPRILLLDEATSSLDNESEQLVQDALSRLMENRTTIIIAHRLSTVQIANRIAVINEGRVVELGSHDELIERDGLYARLYEKQFRDNRAQALHDSSGL